MTSRALVVLALACAFSLLPTAWLASADPPEPTSPSSLPAGWERESPGIAIAGVVLLPTGKPAIGANVYFDAGYRTLGESDDTSWLDLHSRRKKADGSWEWVEPQRAPPRAPFRTTTDADGRYAFRVTPEMNEVLDRRVKVWAEMDGMVALRASLTVESQPARVRDLTLGKALTPRVRVTTFDGVAVSGAHVELSLEVPDAPRKPDLELYCSAGARTDANGLAVFPSVPDRSDWRVSLRVNPVALPRHRRDLMVDHLRGDAPLEVKISRGFTLRGRVALPGGIPGADVWVVGYGPSDPQPPRGHWTTTSADGTFDLTGVPTPNGTVLFVQLPDPSAPRGVLEGATRGAPARLTKQVAGTEGGTVDLGVIELPKALSIRGVVLGPAGHAVERGHVTLDGIGMGRRLQTFGRFEVDGVEPGRHSLKVVIYEAQTDGTLATTVSDVEAGTQDLVVRVTGGGNLVVRFHPVGKPDEALFVRGAKLWGRGSTFLDETLDVSEVRFAMNPGSTDAIRVSAKGYKVKVLGPIEILADRKTVVDVELESE